MKQEITSNGLTEEMERQYNSEYPFYAQTNSWCSGMTYKYSPDDYLLTRDQFRRMQDCGQLMGNYLTETVPNIGLLEFRLDFVRNMQGKLFVTEVQTDDRGLPAMAITRNVRGIKNPDVLPGVTQSFKRAMQIKSGKENPSLVIVYSSREAFYYAGFNDFARLCWAENTKSSIIAIPETEITSSDDNFLKIKIPNMGITLIEEPDFIWDFSLSLPRRTNTIQSMVDKQILIDIWRDKGTPLAIKLRDYIPLSIPARESKDVSQKEGWILKPVSGRWSKGVLIGKNTSALEWEKAINQEEDLVAQEFIDPYEECFYIRNKKRGTYQKSKFFTRIEGYYCLGDSGWELSDVLVTGTPDIPVHGKRDCIMIPSCVNG